MNQASWIWWLGSFPTVVYQYLNNSFTQILWRINPGQLINIYIYFFYLVFLPNFALQLITWHQTLFYFHIKTFITDWTRSVRSRISQSVSKFRWSTIYSAIKNLKRTRMAYNSPSLYGSRNDWPSIIYRAHQNNPRTRIELLSAFYCQHKDRKDLIYLTNFINTILPKAAYPNCLLPFYTKPFDMCLFYSSLHI